MYIKSYYFLQISECVHGCACLMTPTTHVKEVHNFSVPQIVFASLYFGGRCERLPAPASAPVRWSSTAEGAVKTPDPRLRNPAWLLSLEACLN